MVNNSLEDLVKQLKLENVLHYLSIEDALRKVDRKDFVLQDLQKFAYDNRPLPIVNGQTISQPATVVFMLELLKIKEGDKILDIGAGSGWVSCLLGVLTGKKGKVYAYEIDREVGKIGQKNIKEKCKAKNIHYIVDDASKKWLKYGPYDKIHAAAAFAKIPIDLINQLKIGGKMIAPTQEGDVKLIVRKAKDVFMEASFKGFVFVPFIQK